MNSHSYPASYRRVRNILLLFVGILCAVLAVQLFLNLLVIPRMRIGQILLESTLQIPDQDLLEMGGVSGRINYLTLDEQELQGRFEASPLIRKAFVQKQFPNTLKIILYGRNPLGVALLQEGDRTVSAVFDDQGVIFHKGNNAESFDLPILSGMRLENIREGVSLPEVLLPLFQSLKELQEDSPLLFDQISELRINARGDDYFYLTLYLSSYTLPVLIKSSLDDSLMRKILLVLDVLKGRKMLADIEYADFRSGQVVLKMREDG
jgi:cell division septal protein FtsQ